MIIPRHLLAALLVVIGLTGLTGCYYDNEEELYPFSSTTCDTTGFSSLTYQPDLKPLFDTQCAIAGCHVANGAPGNFSTYAGIQARLPDIRQRVCVVKDMPLSPGQLTPCERAKVRVWIDAGAPEL